MFGCWKFKYIFGDFWWLSTGLWKATTLASLHPLFNQTLVSPPFLVSKVKCEATCGGPHLAESPKILYCSSVFPPGAHIFSMASMVSPRTVEEFMQTSDLSVMSILSVAS